jgi:hypothetical protein
LAKLLHAEKWPEPTEHKQVKALLAVAKYTGWPHSTLDKWKTSGVIAPNKKGLWDTAEIWQVIASKLAVESGGEAPEGTPDYEVERAWRTQVQRKRDEIKLEQDLGNLVTLESVAIAYRELCESVVNLMAERPGRLSIKLAGADAKKIKAEIEKEDRKLSDEFERMAQKIELQHAEVSD